MAKIRLEGVSQKPEKTPDEAAPSPAPQQASKPQGTSTGTLTAKEKSRLRYQKILKYQKSSQKGQTAQDEGQPGPKATPFRDRAAERRADEKRGVTQPEKYATITEDESKFLGGDVEHTHLVKGLDFVLLQKVRADLDKARQQLTLQTKTSDQTSAPKTLSAAETLVARRIRTTFTTTLHPHSVNFHKQLARLDQYILRSAMKPRQPATTRRGFKSGALCYLYEFEVCLENDRHRCLPPTTWAQEVPLSIHQSHVESVSSSLPGYAPPIHFQLYRYLGGVVSQLQARSSSKATKREAIQQVSPHVVLQSYEAYLSKHSMPFSSGHVPHWEPPSVEDNSQGKTGQGNNSDDEDIYVGVDPFNPSEELTKYVANHVASGASVPEDSFVVGPEKEASHDREISNLSIFDDIASTEEHPPSTLDDHQVRPLSQTLRARKIRVQDAYEEFYPETGFLLDSVDDDDDLEKPGSKKKRGTTGDQTEDPPPRKKLTSRALRRQTEREWKAIESIMEFKKGHRTLDALERDLKLKPNAASTNPSDVV